MEMRAKMVIRSVTQNEGGSETLKMSAVAAPKYPADGADENNIYAKFSPSADLQITISNPALAGKFKPGESLYLDFSKAPR